MDAFPAQIASRPGRVGGPTRARHVLAVLCASLCCGCTDRQGEQSKPVDDAVTPNSKVDVASRYAKILAYQYRTDGRGVRTELRRVLDKEADIARMTSYFKQLDCGEESPTAATWEPDARIEFARKDGTVLTVHLDSDLEYWTEGAGDWRLPREFTRYFRSLFAAPNEQADAEANANRDRPISEVTAAEIHAYYDADRESRDWILDVTDRQRAQRLASFFPEMASGKEGGDPAADDAFARIVFIRADRSRSAVTVNYGLDGWSEGNGDWPLPREFAKYLFDLLRTAGDDGVEP